MHAPPTLPASRWALLKRVVAVVTGPALDAEFPIPSSPEHALFNAARSRACPMGSLLALAQTLGTALDFRSGVDPCQRMTLRIQD